MPLGLVKRQRMTIFDRQERIDDGGEEIGTDTADRVDLAVTEDRFKLGRVWMLLDAVDEMGIDASIALANMARQLRGWVGGAPKVLNVKVHTS